jgi:hypothetical protein
MVPENIVFQPTDYEGLVEVLQVTALVAFKIKIIR